jgi:uncharacterized delta-60 repeat protein
MLSAGDLDPSFSGDGKQLVDLPGSGTEVANAVAVQPDGKTVLAGKFTGASEIDFVVARLNPNGSLDTTFGGGDGFVTIDFAGPDEALDVALDSASKIVVVGTSSTGAAGSNVRNFAIARLNTNGTLDTTFSSDGKQTVDFGSNDDATSVAIDSASIYVGGYMDLGTTGDFALAKLTSAGALDTTYSADGKVNFAFGGNNNSRSFDIAVAPGGKILMAGYDDNLSAAGHTQNMAVARLGTTGALDTLFSGNGLATVDVSFDDQATAIAVDLRGRIVVGGFDQPSTGGPDMLALRLLSDGSLDTSFNTDGKFSLNLGNDDRVQDVALEPDGTIVLGGYTLGGGFQGALVELDPFQGNLSASFGDGGDGIQLVDFGGIDQAFGVALGPDFRPVLAGTDGFGHIAIARFSGLIDVNFTSPFTSEVEPFEAMAQLPDGKLLALTRSHVQRLLPDGSVDPTFNTIFNNGMRAEDLAVDHAGRIVVAGAASGTNLAMVRRYLSTGAPDSSFSGDGQMTFTYQDTTDVSEIEAIAIDASNRIVTAGHFGFIGGASEHTALARITAAGALDSSFDNDGTRVFALSAINLDEADAVAIQPWDGQIVFAGTDAGNVDVFRLNPDGSRDTSFAGLNGGQEFGFGLLTFGQAMSIAFDAGHRIVLGGFFEHSGSANDEGFVARVNSDGSMDTTFGTGGGKLPLQFSAGGEHVNGVAIDPAGDIVTIGVVNFADGDDRILVRKLLPTGASGDFDFSGDGAWVAPLASFEPVGFPQQFGFLASGAVYVTGSDHILRMNVEPAIVDFAFEFETAPQTLRVQFNDDVGTSLADADLTIHNNTTGVNLTTTNFDVVSYNALTNTAIINFNLIIPDGDYTATFSSTGIENRQGQNLSGDRTRDFFFLRGDATRDRFVNLLDFNILAANFGQSPRTFSQGDFNYDGTVNLLDFNILANKFGASLGPGTFSANAVGATSQGTRLLDALRDDVLT